MRIRRPDEADAKMVRVRHVVEDVVRVATESLDGACHPPGGAPTGRCRIEGWCRSCAMPGWSRAMGRFAKPAPDRARLAKSCARAARRHGR